MIGSRRRLFAAGGGLLCSLAGCLSSFSGSPQESAPESPGSEPGDSTATRGGSTDTRERRTSRRTTTNYPETVRATKTVDREGVEYVASNDTVRYVAAWRTNRSGETITRKPVYETVPFEEWAEVECASVAAGRVSEAMDRRLDGDDEGVAVGVTTGGDGERVVLVAHQTRLDRDGDVISEPKVSYERVKRVAPKRVSVAFSFGGRTRDCTVAVTTREATIREQ